MAIVFEYDDYRDYLGALLNSRTGLPYGAQSKLAKTVGCQPSHISKVLHKQVHFSLEQADATNDFLAHSEDESHFFILLVEYTRAGTQKLRQYFWKQITECRQRHLDMKSRFKLKDQLSGSQQITFYSHWFYSAIHILLSIPEYQTIEAISRKLSLNLRQVKDVLEFFEGTGMVERAGNRYKAVAIRSHLSRKSPLILKHHTNWRLQAIHSLDRLSEKDLHYSAVTSLSEMDMDKIREILTQAIETSNELIKESKEEVACGFCVDFFEI